MSKQTTLPASRSRGLLAASFTLAVFLGGKGPRMKNQLWLWVWVWLLVMRCSGSVVPLSNLGNCAVGVVWFAYYNGSWHQQESSVPVYPGGQLNWDLGVLNYLGCYQNGVHNYDDSVLEVYRASDGIVIPGSLDVCGWNPVAGSYPTVYLNSDGTCDGQPTTNRCGSVILFTWDFPKDGLQALPADGQSSVNGSVAGGSGTLSWSFDGPSLGCTLVGTATGVTVYASTNTGSVLVQASDSTGVCFEQPLELVECSSCASGSCPAGGFSADLGSVDVKIGLGWAPAGNTAGYLHIKESAPTNAIATPKALHYDFVRPQVEVYSNSYGLYQVRSPETFVNVITNSISKYSIQLFSATNITNPPMTGPYTPPSTPYRTLTVENPSGNTNEVLVTDSNDGSTYDYTWQGNGWLLATGNGLRNELKTTVVSSTNNAIYIVTNTVWQGNSPPVLTKIETYQTNSYGNRLIAQVSGSGGAARTNTYSYTANGYLQQAVRWDGSWEYYLYDGSNRPTNIFSGFLNQGVTTNRALCRLIEHDYSTNVISGAGDNGNTYLILEPVEGESK